MKKIFFILIYALSGTLQAGNEADIKQVTAHLPPYTIDSSTIDPGFSVEILKDVHDRAGLPYNPVFMPWPRAQDTVKNSKNANYLIFTLTRTEKREKLYKWILEVLPVKTAFVSIEHKTPINSVEEAIASKLMIGVAGSTPWSNYLSKYDIPEMQLDVISREHSNAQKLIYGRIKLWFVPADRGIYYLKQLGLDKKPVIGKPLVEGHLYLAANLNFPDEIIEKLRKAFEESKKAGVYDKIYKKYFYIE